MEHNISEPLGAALHQLVRLKGTLYEDVCREACNFIPNLARGLSYRGTEWAIMLVPHLLDKLQDSGAVVRGWSSLYMMSLSSPSFTLISYPISYCLWMSCLRRCIVRPTLLYAHLPLIAMTKKATYYFPSWKKWLRSERSPWTGLSVASCMLC